MAPTGNAKMYDEDEARSNITVILELEMWNGIWRAALKDIATCNR